MAESVRIPKSVWRDPEWCGMTAGAQLFAMAAFMFRKSGAVTDQRVKRKTRWDDEFIKAARAEVEASAYAHWLVASGKRRRLSRALANKVFERDGYACVVCGATEPLEVDHIHPVKHGGSDDMENLQTLCQPHNRAKGASLDWSPQ